MSIQSYNLTKNLINNIVDTDGNTKKILVANNLPTNTFLGLDSNVKILGQNIVIKDITAFTKLPSLAPSPIPNVTIDDSDSDKLIKFLDNEYHSQRYQLNVYLGEILLNTINYVKIGAISLLNQQGYQFNYYDLLALIGDNFELGNNFCLAVAIENVGMGYLKYNDLLNIHGYYIQEIILDIPTSNNIISLPTPNPSPDNTTTNVINYNDISDSQWSNLTDSQWSNL